MLSPALCAHISFFCEGGHAAVNRSLEQGCELNAIEHNWNPDEACVYPTVVVLGGISKLNEAIDLKKRGLISKLIAGPNLVVRSCDHGAIIADDAIDTCIVSSEWERIAFEEDAPDLIGHTRVWAAGVDEYYWRPSNVASDEKKNVIVYWKTESEFFINEIQVCLGLYGWNPILIKYGNYEQHEFKQLLEDAAFAVFVSVAETQGIALAESWAMNVPTIAWDPQYFVGHGRVYSIVSSCPYLTDMTGKRWKTIHEFEALLRDMRQLLPAFTPRHYVLSAMTDKKAVQQLLAIIG
jgi:hypothetical protein